MTDQNRPIHKHKRQAREHLTGLEKSQAEVQQLAAKHLAGTARPVRDRPASE